MRSSPRSVSRLGIAGFAAALLLSGCGSGQTGMYAQYIQVIKQSFGGGGITRQQAAAIPYASIGYRINDGDQIMLVLATDNGGDQLWTSSNHVVFQTRDGRLTRTVGLPVNLGSVTPKDSGGLPAPAAALQQPFTSRRLADFPELGLYSLLVTCTARALGTQNVTILGQASPPCAWMKPARIGNQTGTLWTAIGWIPKPAWPGVRFSISRPRLRKPKSSYCARPADRRYAKK